MFNSTVSPDCDTIEESIGFHKEPKTGILSIPPPLSSSGNCPARSVAARVATLVLWVVALLVLAATPAMAQDNTAPTVTSAATASATNYNKIEFRFSEQMNSSGLLRQVPGRAFTFTIGGDTTIANRTWVSGNKLTLHLTRAIYSGQAITVSYDPDLAQLPNLDFTYSGDYSLRDRAGNRLAAFSNLSVTNNSSLAKPQLKLQLVGNQKAVNGGGSVTYRIRASGSSAIWASNSGNSSQACVSAYYRLDWTTPWPSHTPGRDIGSRNACLHADYKEGNYYWDYTTHISSQDDRPMLFTPKLLAGNQYTRHSERSLKIAVNPQIEVKDAEATEGTNANLRFKVTLRPAAVVTTTVAYATSDGTATAGSDYTATSGTLTFNAGNSIKYISVPITNDTVADSGETLTLTLSSPSGVMRLVKTRSRCVEKVPGDGTCISWIPTVFASTVTATGTILNDEPGPSPAVEDLPLVTIRATSAYLTEGSDAVFELTRTGDSSEALTVPVSVRESGAMLDASLPTSATFAAGEQQMELRVLTVADDAAEDDSTVTVGIRAGSAYRLGANYSSEVEVTVLDDDAAPLPSGTSAIADVAVWSADMTVMDYQNGSIGAGSADLLANQGGSGGLRAKWLYYHTGERKLRMKFTTDVYFGGLTLHAGDVMLAFRGEGDSSFTWENVDIDWTDGQMFEARLVREGSAGSPAPDPTLKSLVISDVAVSPVFDAGTLLYTAVVDSATASVTVSAESNDGDAEVVIVPSEDADSEQEGHQVAVPVGETLATVTVTAADGETQRAYRVIVKRWPTVAVSFGSESHTATEGGDAASVIVELDADPGRDVTIPLTASPAGGAAAEDYMVPGSVTFTRGGALSQGVEVTAVADDTAEEGESVVLGFGDFPDGVEAGATTSAAVTLADADAPAVNTAPTGLPTITGMPQVGETLTASVTEIEDGDGLASPDFAYQWVSNNGTSDSDIEDATNTTYTVAASDADKTIKVRVTFTDDGGTQETLMSVATDVVAISLTASFEDVPDEHDGSSRFTFRVRFNVEPRVGYGVLRDESFAVTGGVVKKARRVDGRNDLREIHIDPLGWGDVTVTLPGGRACGTTGAICTADGKVLSNTETATVQGPPALNVADARVEEGGDATLDFVVTLSRAASVTVTVDYATSDDTATAGADYTTASGTLTFAAGTTEQRVSVPVLDDAIDDGGETLTLMLSNASGAWIEDGAATGTIENSDPMPKAWLARFGRTVASQAVEALEERMAQPQGVTRLNLGGGVSGFYGEAPAQGKAEIFIEEESEGNWGSEDAAHNPVEVSPEAVLLGSSFHLAVADLDEQGRAVPGPWAIWGRGATTRFEGADGDLSIDGNVSTGMLGADYRWGRMMFGTAVSRSVSDGDFTLGGELGGSVESSLTAAYPYLRVSATERLSLWGMLGYGKGSMSLEDMGSADMKTDISMKMGAFGARGDILSGEKGFSLAVKSEALWVRVESDSVAGLVSVEADASRIRTVVEGGFAFPVGSGVFTPLVEAGLRHDGGDAETGFGAEVGGGLRYSNSALGLDMEFTARRLVAHGDEGLRGVGVGGFRAF